MKKKTKDQYIIIFFTIMIIGAFMALESKSSAENEEVFGKEQHIDHDDSNNELIMETVENKKTGYIFPESDSRFLESEELHGLTKEECRIARNEIYARHGRIFNDNHLKMYFESCEWYEPTTFPEDFDEAVLNEFEIVNRDLISAYEYEKGYR